ncbi:hypothetical protein Tco_0521760 [Tanacetum coccineum]
MADLQFVDQHNMVACLERSDENAEFHQIVDFLTTSSIHYALTWTPKKVGDEAVYTGEDDRVVRAATTASSLEAEDLVQSSCLGKLKDCSRLGDPKAEKRVKRLEKALRARTSWMKLFKIGISRIKGLDKENVSKQGRKSDKTKPIVCYPSHVSTAGPLNVSVVGPSKSTTEDIFEDEMTTIADTLVAISSARPRTSSVMIRNVEEEPRRATPAPAVQSQDKGIGKMVEPEPTPKNLRKAQIQTDEELAQRLFEEEQAQFEKEQRIAREKAAEQEAKDVALIEQIEDVQTRMDADELLAERLQQEERE